MIYPFTTIQYQNFRQLRYTPSKRAISTGLKSSDPLVWIKSHFFCFLSRPDLPEHHPLHTLFVQYPRMKKICNVIKLHNIPTFTNWWWISGLSLASMSERFAAKWSRTTVVGPLCQDLVRVTGYTQAISRQRGSMRAKPCSRLLHSKLRKKVPWWKIAF